MIRGFLILMLVTLVPVKTWGACVLPNHKTIYVITSSSMCGSRNGFFMGNQNDSEALCYNNAVWNSNCGDRYLGSVAPASGGGRENEKPPVKPELPPLPTIAKKGCTYSDDSGGSIYSPSMSKGDCKDMGGSYISEKQAKQSQANYDAEVAARKNPPKEGGASETASKDKKEDNKNNDTTTRTAAADDAAIATYTQAKKTLADDQKKLETDQKQLDQFKAKDDRLAELNDKQDAYDKQNSDPKNLSNSDYKPKSLTPDEQKEQKSLAAGADARETKESELTKNIETEKGTVNDDKKAVADAKEDYDQAEADKQIIVKNENEDYGGHYQGASVKTTENINKGATLMSQVTDKMGENAVKQSSDDAAKALAEKGATATDQSVIDAHNSVKDKAVAKLNSAGILNMALGAYQALRGYEHFNSIAKVEGVGTNANGQWTTEKVTAETALTTAKAKLEACVAPACTTQAAFQKEVDSAQTRLNTANDNLTNITTNQSGETEAQGAAAGQQGMVAAASILKGANMLNDAKNLEVHLGQAGAGKQFNMANNQGFQGAGPTDPTLAPIVQQSEIVQNDPAAKPELGGREQFNPNDPSSAPQGPVATAWQDGPAQVGQSGGGGGVGGVGSTSAASSDTPPNAQAGAQPKAGSYASSGSGGGSYKGKSSGGSGAKVGVDSGFADLLKKFLPGGEADKKKNVNAAVNFADRSPASDQAAVISRNKNIFDEIHKRYEKKNNEGAIVF